MAVSVTLPILFLVPLMFLMTLGLGILYVGMEKCSIRSEDIKFSVAPLSISALTWEWIILEWNVMNAWTEF